MARQNQWTRIYNSRNYSILLNALESARIVDIYNSRNYSILLNLRFRVFQILSTTVEIILYYLTFIETKAYIESTTVEIILYYLTG